MKTVQNEIDRLRSIHDASIPYIDHSGNIMKLIEEMERMLYSGGEALAEIHRLVTLNPETENARSIGILALNGLKIVGMDRKLL